MKDLTSGRLRKRLLGDHVDRAGEDVAGGLETRGNRVEPKRVGAGVEPSSSQWINVQTVRLCAETVGHGVVVAGGAALHVQVDAPVVMRVVQRRDEVAMLLSGAVAQLVQPHAQRLRLRCVGEGNPRRYAGAAVEKRDRFELRIKEQRAHRERREFDALEAHARRRLE